MAEARQDLEAILVQSGVVTAQDLERARRRMAERGGRLAANLFAVGKLGEVRFAQALAKALGVPYVDANGLRRIAAPRSPARRAALRTLAIERVLLPIGARRDPLTVEVAMFDPTDDEAVARLKQICGGADIRRAVAPRRQLLEAIAQVFGREASGELDPDKTPAVETGDGGMEEIERDTMPIIADAIDDDAPTPGLVDRTVAQAVHLSNELASDIPLSGDTEAPTPPPVILASRDNRFVKVLMEAVALLADQLEESVSTRPRRGRELARYSRLVARNLGCAPSVVDEIGVAAHLHAVEAVLRERARREGEALPDLADALGWSAGAPEGTGPILRALSAVADGFPAPVPGEGPGVEADAPLGARIIAAVSEYLALEAATADGQPDRQTVNQLLRLTTPPEIIEALLRVTSAGEAKGTPRKA